MQLRGIKGAAIGLCVVAALISVGLLIPEGWWHSKLFWVIVSTTFAFGSLLDRRRWLFHQRKFLLLPVLLAAHLILWIPLVYRLYPPNHSHDQLFVLIIILEGIFLNWAFRARDELVPPG